MQYTEEMYSSMPQPLRSPAIEGYLKAIYLLQQDHKQVTTSLVAEHFTYAPASVTGMLQRLARLGHPTADPHGDPIPSSDGTMPMSSCNSLHDLAIDVLGQIIRVKDQHPNRLRYLADLGFVPGAIVTVHARAPFDGPLTLGIGSNMLYLDSSMARAIFIRESVA